MTAPVLETTVVLNSNEISTSPEQHQVKITQRLDWMDLEFENGHKISIEIEDGAVRVHTYTPEADAPVSLRMDDDVVTVETRDFEDEGGFFTLNPEI